MLILTSTMSFYLQTYHSDVRGKNGEKNKRQKDQILWRVGPNLVGSSMKAPHTTQMCERCKTIM